MGATSNRSYPYPVDSDDFNPDADIQALAEAVDTDLQAVDDANISGRPRFIGTVSTAFTNNTIGTITPASAVVNVGGMWSSGTNITLPTADEYELGIVLRYPSQASATGVRQARINLNGSEFIVFQVPTTSALNATNIIVAGTIKDVFAANDVISFGGFQNSGVSQTIIGNSRIWVARTVQ